MVRAKKAWELAPGVNSKQSWCERQVFGKKVPKNSKYGKNTWKKNVAKKKADRREAQRAKKKAKYAKKGESKEEGSKSPEAPKKTKKLKRHQTARKKRPNGPKQPPKKEKISLKAIKKAKRKAKALNRERMKYNFKTVTKKGVTKTYKTKKEVPVYHKHVPITKPFYWDLDQQTFRQERILKRKEKKKVVAPLRKSLTPGTIVILLGGPSKGKRCVFLKQLSSGLILVIGPYKVNKIPLRRVNQAYVIATSMKLDLSKKNFWRGLTEVDDPVFKQPKLKKKNSKDGPKKEFFEGDEKERRSKKPRRALHSPKMVKLTARIDKACIEEMSKVPNLRRYMTTKFRLQAHTYPHLMKF